MKKIIKFLLLITGGLILASLVAFAIGFVAMHLWNWLMPPLFNLSRITFLQAWGLVLLGRLLFGGIGHSKFHEHHKDHHRRIQDKIRNWMHKDGSTCCGDES